jgi:uncharacterized YigZ family protein
MESYVTVHHHATFEYEDRKSIFIGEAMPVSTEEEALSFIESVKKEYPDARHHVYAYVLRDNSIMRFTDDGEPQGTAGMPVLDVIRKNGLTDIAVIVTRYFGGTLLGTGGLVRAYTAAALGAVKDAQIITYDIYATISIEASYSDYQKFAPIFAETGYRSENIRYTDKVILVGSIRKAHADRLIDKLVQVTSGRVKAEIIDEKFDF